MSSTSEHQQDSDSTDSDLTYHSSQNMEDAMFTSEDDDVILLTEEEDDVISINSSLEVIDDLKEPVDLPTTDCKNEPGPSKESDIIDDNKATTSNRENIKTIMGVEVEFPVKPYKSQIALMSGILRGIEKNQNCLLESPTGTGKTLALLCAALAWQKRERALRLTNCVVPLFGEETSNQTLPSEGLSTSSAIPVPDNDENPMKKIKTSTENESRVNMSTPKKSSISISSPNSTPEKSFNMHKVSTIYFCSRTHKQLQQAIKELKRTVYAEDIQMTTLSSRKQLCIQTLDRIYSSKDDMCQKAVNKRSKTKSGCVFFDNVDQMLSKCSSPLLNGVWDIEDLLTMGDDHGGCPFYASRKLANRARIVFCPYNYIINPLIRSALEIQLSENIIIIDEAHNIEDCCRESVSLNFTFQDIIDCKQDLERIYPIYRQRHHEFLTNYMKNWFDWFRNHNNMVEGEGTYAMNGDKLCQSLQTHELSRNHTESLSAQITAVTTNIQSLEKKKDIYMREITDKSLTLLKNLYIIFGFFFNNPTDYCAVLTKKPKFAKTGERTEWSENHWLSTDRKKSETSYDLSVLINCLNPAVAFKDVAENARCVILTSGTLSPVSSFSSELGTEFPIVMQLSHNISRDQLWISSVCNGPGEVNLKSTFSNTKDPNWQDSLGSLILWICQAVPHGVLCFLPSYSLLNILFRRWNENNVMRDIQKHKNIFSEGTSAEEHNYVMSEYYSCCTSDKGALLFAVYRGKISEGMDFKDEQARAVITVGIPYPNIKDETVQSKMKFNDHYQKQRNLLPGSEWLRIQAFRALNQALGRCIRHQNDWGAVIMVDSRFSTFSNVQGISKWAQQFIQLHTSWRNFSNNDNDLIKFMKNKQ